MCVSQLTFRVLLSYSQYRLTSPAAELRAASSGAYILVKQTLA
jgi:hypothetical protein